MRNVWSELVLSLADRLPGVDVEVIAPREITGPLVLVDTSMVSYEYSADRRIGFEGTVRLELWADDFRGVLELHDAVEGLAVRAPAPCSAWRVAGEPSWSGVGGSAVACCVLEVSVRGSLA